MKILVDIPLLQIYYLIPFLSTFAQKLDIFAINLLILFVIFKSIGCNQCYSTPPQMLSINHIIETHLKQQAPPVRQGTGSHILPKP